MVPVSVRNLSSHIADVEYEKIIPDPGNRSYQRVWQKAALRLIELLNDVKG